MKKIFIKLLLFMGLLFNCMTLNLSTSMKITGKAYTSLKTDSEIMVVMEKKEIPAYEKIGIIEVRQIINDPTIYEPRNCINNAKKKAQQYGANIIILSDIETFPSASGGNIYYTEVYTFIAGRIIAK